MAEHKKKDKEKKRKCARDRPINFFYMMRD